MRTEQAYFLLYDSECRICTAFARTVRMLDVRRRLRVRSIQASGELLAAIPETEWLEGAHAVSPDGRVSTGAAAMPALIAALVAGPELERRLRASRASMAALSRIYGVMTELRGRLTCATGAPFSARHSPR
jgi:predicted DCC family thiol-disulfide oxidoreductase YuxK